MTSVTMPERCDLFYGGRWHRPKAGRYVPVTSPATGERLAEIADADVEDVDDAIAAALSGFREWRLVPPLQRAAVLRAIAGIIRSHGPELAALDAADGGNPVKELIPDIENAAAQFEFFAGLVTEMKGASVPMGPDAINFSIREPLGVVARIVPFNHPFMFCAAKSAAPLAAGNAVIVKPPEQAPLSGLRLAELIGGLLPPGVFNVVPGGRDVGARLAAHPDIAKVALIGSVQTGRAVMRAAADTLKPVLLELGGKNALIAFPDADPDRVADAVVSGMNFGWCGQSCGSTSRAMIHDALYEPVVERLAARCARFKPGLPTDPATTMGAIISKAQYERVLHYIETARREGARLVTGGGRPEAPELASGYFIEPTIFADVTPQMTIAREEIFGPVLAVMRWSDEAAMRDVVNATEYGLTCSIWTRDITKAYRTAMGIDAGFLWINETSRHFLGTPFGGVKQSGLGREECLEELLGFTREKHIHVNLRQQGPPAAP